jgi:exopolysaccharide biosynthesis polyprenyl glycosylphosphotransferase
MVYSSFWETTRSCAKTARQPITPPPLAVFEQANEVNREPRLSYYLARMGAAARLLLRTHIIESVADAAEKLEPQRAHGRVPLQRQSARRIALRVLADAMAVSTALFLSSAIRFELFPGSPRADLDYGLITALATPAWLLLFWAYRLYEPRQVLSPVNELKHVLHGVMGGIVVLFVADSLFDLGLARGWMLTTMVSGLVVVSCERLLVRKMLHFVRRRGGNQTRTIVLGTNHEARTIARTLQREKWLGHEIIGFVDDRIPAGETVVAGHVVLGRTSELKDVIADHSATHVIVATMAFDASRLNRVFWELQDVDVDLQITSGTIDLMASRMVVQSVAGVPLLYIRRTGIDRAQRTVKRAIDVVASLLGLVVLSPVLAAIALWIRSDSEGSIFFKQVRIGRHGKNFTCWKYRSMFVDAEEKRQELEHLSQGPGLLFKLKDDPRVTRCGKFLRRYSLDELPQLWNVLKGDMSLVGPRPALPSEVEQYDDWVTNRLKVKPGMTGLWQVSGRTETTFSDYVRFDLFYIQNWSLTLDLWILWRTFRAVLTTEGAH